MVLTEKRRGRRSSRSHRRPRCLLLVLVVALILGVVLWQYDNLEKLYRVYSAFSPERLPESFRSFDELFPSRRVSSSTVVSSFTYDIKTLPLYYSYQGEKKSVQEFFEETNATGLIVSDGKSILFEEYYLGNTEDSRAITWSVSKSVVSLLLGIALEEGLILSLFDPVTNYVPTLISTGYEGVSIMDVLQMSSGISVKGNSPWTLDIHRLGARSFGLFGSFSTLLAKLQREREPGTLLVYTNSNTQVLGMVIRYASGRTLADFTQEKLWERAGMEGDAYWLTDKTGVEAAFGGLTAVLRDLLRIGCIYLHEGFWNEQQIVSSQWIQASVSANAPHLAPCSSSFSPDYGYGYHWWIPEGPYGDYLARGIYGQSIYVNPYYQVVIARTSSHRTFRENGTEKSRESLYVFRELARSLGTKTSNPMH